MPYAELDGLRLYFERAGRGDLELLFVPGWCCDGTAFLPQFDYFALKYAVTALDLRGCGKSDRPPGGYAIPDLADDVAGFCGAVGIEQPIVVGHSLGGMIAVELAGRRPSLPRALVLVDPGPIDWDPAVARWIADMMSAIPLPIATAVIQHLTAWDGAGAMTRCDVPTLLLRTELDAEDVRLLEIKPDLTVGVTVGAGHFHQIEVPDQVNAMIDRFLALAGL
jgi:pimeloyl-ACP methyl ester carboxylesterase